MSILIVVFELASSFALNITFFKFKFAISCLFMFSNAQLNFGLIFSIKIDAERYNSNPFSRDVANKAKQFSFMEQQFAAARCSVIPFLIRLFIGRNVAGA